MLLKDKVPFSYLNTSVWMACYQEASGSGTHSARGVTFVHAIRGDIAAVHWANCADPEKKCRRSKQTRIYSIKRNELASTQGILEGKLGAWCWITCSIESLELLSFATSIMRSLKFLIAQTVTINSFKTLFLQKASLLRAAVNYGVKILSRRIYYLFPVEENRTITWSVSGTSFWMNTCWSSRSPNGPATDKQMNHVAVRSRNTKE